MWWFKKIVLILLVVCLGCDNCWAATVRRGVSSNTAVSKNVSVRSGTGRTASRGGAVSARGAVAVKTSSNKAPGVVARAATTKNVVSTGVKVDSAQKNTVISEDCQNMYSACMDAFCVVDNVDGGRCVCSDKYKTFDKYFAEIDEINTQTHKLQTVGLEMVDANVSQSPVLPTENIVSVQTATISSALGNGDVGAALKKIAHDTCAEKISQCADKLATLSVMYDGRINSDCVGYENALKNKKADAKQRLQLAEGALQERALEVAKNSNKYDLGQCTVEFKKCMQKKEVCGSDFTGCVDISRGKNKKDLFVIPDAESKMTLSRSVHEILTNKSVMCSSVLNNCVKVQDKVFDTFLRESYTSLMMAEKLAESSVRQNCIANVSSCFRNACRDNIDPNEKNVSYDACLMHPEMVLSFCKAELTACGVDSTDEHAARKSEIWDFVLARLAGMKSDACTNDLRDCLADENRCGKDYSGCVGLSTEQIIRMCPYDKLLGCKNVYDDKLRDDEVYENLIQAVQGIILNIDNKLLQTCQAAVDTVAQRVCGENLDCAGIINLDTIGTTSLDYKICEYTIVGNDVAFTDNCYDDQSKIPDVDLGRVENSKSGKLGPVVPYAVLVDVPIYWESIDVGLDGNFNGLDGYLDMLEDRNVFLTDMQRERLEEELMSLKGGVDRALSAIESDPIVSACMDGRKIDGYDFAKVARFPNITSNVRAIIASKLLMRAKTNYYAKYDLYNERSLRDYIRIAERQSYIKGENFKDKHRELARQSCVGMAEMSALPKSAEPPSSVAGGVLIGVILALAVVAVCVLTAGGGGFAIGALGGALLGKAAAVGDVLAIAGITGIVAGVAGGATAITMAGVAINDAVEKEAILEDTSATFDMSKVHDYKGEYTVKYWNYKEDITTIFNPTDLTCEKCVVSTKCAETKAPMFGDQYCKSWLPSSDKQCVTFEF